VERQQFVIVSSGAGTIAVSMGAVTEIGGQAAALVGAGSN